MEYEVWSTSSGNCLGSFPTPTDALQWVFRLWSEEGDEAVDDLSVSDEQAAWVLRAPQLRVVMRELLWDNWGPYRTATSDPTTFRQLVAA